VLGQNIGRVGLPDMASGGRPSLSFNFAAMPKLDERITFTRASTGTFFNSAGVLTSAATNAPRFDYNPSTLAAQGLLIEESRTNSIRNNTMVGAVAGTPGTLPTNWVQSALGTLTLEVVGTGTENGITYIDIRYSGTTSSTLRSLQFDASTQIAALQNQTWTSSLWIKIAAGSQTNITSISHRIREIDSGGTAIATGTQAITFTSSLTRDTLTRTLASASTAFIANQIAIAFDPGVAIDITLRIGLPQLELGAFATSVIPTTTTALTRAADVASVNTLSPWYNSVEGTLYFEGLTVATTAGLATLQDGSVAEYMRLARGLSKLNGVVSTAAGTQADIYSVADVPLNTVFKGALAVKANDFAISLNGATPVTDTSGAMPSAANQLNIGLGKYLGYINGYVRRITYYPRRLANADLQAITA